MSQHPSDTAAGVPRWLVIAGSVVIAFHLSAIGVRTLAAPSGPWPGSEEGMYMATPPQLAYSLNEITVPYLKAIQLNHNYRFGSNHPMLPGVHLEIRLKDDSGQELAVVRLPDDSANPWVRHRQQLLAGGLAGDVALSLPQMDLVPKEGQEVPKVEYWKGNDADLTLRLESESVNILRSMRPAVPQHPSERADLLAQSYARYLCRAHGAERAEILRYHQDPIQAEILFPEFPSPSMVPPRWTSYFGEFTREGKPIRKGAGR